MGMVDNYIGTWIFRQDNETGANPAAYPPGHSLIIGRDGADQVALSWLDVDNQIHTLGGLRVEEPGGFLHAERATDRSTSMVWKVTVAFQLSGAPGAGPRLVGSVESEGGLGEGNLTGNWGADAPPPVDEGLVARILRWLRGKR